MEILEEMAKTLEDGLILKSARVDAQDVTDEDLKKINKFTLSPLGADDVFTFKTVLGDNETDDRNYEPFNRAALNDMKKLYIGKTVIKDHSRRADNQVARVYDTEVVEYPTKTTGAGETLAQLVAKCYMVKTARNADLITEIKAGIKKEVSTSVRPKKMICNICGTDNAKTYCPHYPGVEYDKDTGRTTCLMTIDGAKEAYELSFVAVPAQPRAGTTKHYGGEKPVAEPETENKETVTDDTPPETENKDSEISARVKLAESFVFTEKRKEV